MYRSVFNWPPQLKNRIRKRSHPIHQRWFKLMKSKKNCFSLSLSESVFVFPFSLLLGFVQSVLFLFLAHTMTVIWCQTIPALEAGIMYLGLKFLTAVLGTYEVGGGVLWKTLETLVHKPFIPTPLHWLTVTLNEHSMCWIWERRV